MNSVQQIREALQEMSINEAGEDLSKFEALLKKYKFKKSTGKGDGITYSKGDYEISVSKEAREAEHRWSSEFITKAKKIYLFGGTPLNVLSQYLSGKGAGKLKRSMGDKSEEATIKRMSK